MMTTAPSRQPGHQLWRSCSIIAPASRSAQEPPNKDDNITSDAAAIPSAAPLSVQGGRAFGRVFPWLSHTTRRGGEPRMKTTTTPPMLLPFHPPRRCQCKGDAPPGVSSLGSATRRDEGGTENEDSNNTSDAAAIPSAAPLSVRGGPASWHVFPWLSHTT